VDELQGKFEALSKRIHSLLTNFEQQKERSEQLLTAASFLKTKVRAVCLLAVKVLIVVFID
jgi:hypothetical protein